MKNAIFLGIALVLLVAGCLGPSQPPQGKGRVVVTMADAAADMGAVSSVKVTVDSVSVQSASAGWVTLNATPKTYDLLELKSSGQEALLAEARLDPGKYEQMRLKISKVVVTDANGTHEAKLPSGDLKIVGGFTVGPNSTSTATFDFVADESLHVTGNGQYILAPVIRVVTRENASAQVGSDGRVTISGGQIKVDLKVGMDEKGNLGTNLRIPADASVKIENGVIVVTPPGLNVTKPPPVNVTGKVIVGVTDAAANLSSVSKILVTIDEIRVHSASKGWVDLNSSPVTVDLLELNSTGDIALLANTTLEAGTYQQIRLLISKVVVVDANGTKDAKLPSGELKVIGDLVVGNNTTSTAVFDFLAGQSLHLANNGTLYVFAPVVRFTTTDDAQVQGKGKDRVVIKGSKIRTNVTVGMDASGNVGEGLRIPPNAAVTIQNGTLVINPPGQGTPPVNVTVGAG